MEGFSNLSRDALTVIQIASAETRDRQHFYLGVEHIVLALCKIPNRQLERMMSRLEIDRKVLRQHLGELPSRDEPPLWGDSLKVTPRTTRIMQLAQSLAEQSGKGAVSPVNVLEAVLLEGRSIPVRIMCDLGMATQDAMAKVIEDDASAPSSAGSVERTRSRTPYIDEFGRDLCDLARRGELRPVIGRKAEMLAVVRVLARHERNNPLLIGDPGVGKTCVVEGLAQRAISEDGPRPLRGKRIVQLAPSALVAGTQYRGEFEKRLETILQEARDSGDIVLFFDEMHTLLGAGAAGSGTIDASNMLKPVLARGEIACIAATTTEEYHRHVENDAALARRFEIVTIPEPSPEETVEMLCGLRPTLEEHHQITIGDEVLEEVVRLAERYIGDRFLPDKAVDILDRACAELTIQSLTGSGGQVGERVLTTAIVARVISQATGIPVGVLSKEDAEGLLHLESELATRVLGQDEALAKVTECVIAGRELGFPNRPDGVLLFLGPTGVGKTEVAKALAAALFGSERHLVRIDMSEYREPHNVARLIGAPPGYIGHDEEGQLTGAVRRRPYTVILMDEVEKAHPDVMHLFLQVFDDARLTDNRGRTVDFSHAIIIMTSNLASREVAAARRPLGFQSPAEEAPEAQHEATKAVAEKALEQAFPPELLNRIDEVVVFQPLSRETVRRIVDLVVSEIENELAQRQLRLEVAEDLADLFAERGYDETYGARELRRTVDRLLRKPLAQFTLETQPPPGATIYATRQGEQTSFSLTSEPDSQGE